MQKALEDKGDVEEAVVAVLAPKETSSMVGRVTSAVERKAKVKAGGNPLHLLRRCSFSPISPLLFRLPLL